MNIRTLLTVTCLLATLGCRPDAGVPPPPAAEPKVASQPAAAAKPATPKPTPAAKLATPKPERKLPTAAEIAALIDQATRIEARSGTGQKPTWSKDLTAEDVAKLKAGIGAAEVSPAAPRCLPTVTVTLYGKDKPLATLGGFCSSTNPMGLMRFDIAGATGSLRVQDVAKVNAALESPVDR